MQVARRSGGLGGRTGAWPLWALWVALGILTVGLLVPGGESNSPAHDWLSMLCDWVPVAVCWVAASRVGFRSVQVSLAATAVTVFALGDSYYVAATTSGTDLPFPSAADIGYLLFYVLMLAALAALVHRQLQGVASSVLLDSAIGSVAAAAVLAVLLSPILTSAPGGSWGAAVVGVAYPLLDLILVAAAVGVAVAPGLQLGRGWVLLICGLLVFAAADIAFALMDFGSGNALGTTLDAGRLLGLAFVATWVDGSTTPPARPVAGSRERGPWSFRPSQRRRRWAS